MTALPSVPCSIRKPEDFTLRVDVMQGSPDQSRTVARVKIKTGDRHRSGGNIDPLIADFVGIRFGSKLSFVNCEP